MEALLLKPIRSLSGNNYNSRHAERAASRSRASKGALDLTFREAAARAGQPEAAYWIFSIKTQ